MFDRLSLVGLAVLGTAALTATASADDWKIHGLEDGNVYTKPYSNLQGTWKEEFGVSAPLLTNGPWTLKWSVAYLQVYGKSWGDPQQWTGGLTAVYEFGTPADRIRTGLYTKTKKDDPGFWQQESGITARTRYGRFGLVGNFGYIFRYPRRTDVIPLWQAGVSLCWYFK